MRASQKKLLQAAGVGGLATFSIGVLVLLMSQLWAAPSRLAPIGILVDVVGTACFAAYVFGFTIIGATFKKPLITISAYAIIALTILSSAVFYLGGPHYLENEVTGIIFGFSMSTSMIVLGWQMLRLNKRVGFLSVCYGCLEMLEGAGVIYLLPLRSAWLFESIIHMALFASGVCILFLLTEGVDDIRGSFRNFLKRQYFWFAMALFAAGCYFTLFGVMRPNGCLPFDPQDPSCQGERPPSLN